MFVEVLRRLEERRAAIAVVGLGYVGLPLARALGSTGHRVIGYDIDPAKAAKLREGRSYIKGVADADIRRMLDEGRFEPTTDVARMAEADAILICVPTPLSRNREPDLSYITGTAESLLPHLRPGQLVVLESTTYPGTTTEVMRPILERGGLRSEADLFIAYSPEREDPGNASFTTSTIPKVVGGEGPLALALARTLYGQFTSAVPVSDTRTAEAVKLTENIFRSVNIALVNELKTVYEAMGIDVWEVIDAARTKPFGFTAFYPGPGLGGHCIPIDPFYLTWKAREYEVPVRFVELAGEINTAMPRRVVEKLALALDRRAGKGLSGARILLVGIAYKKNVDDVRESPGLRLMELLEERGAEVAFHDPYAPVIPPTREHGALAGRRSVPLAPEVLAEQDAVLIVTDHDGIDWAALVDGARLVVDTRNATRAVGLNRERIVKA